MTDTRDETAARLFAAGASAADAERCADALAALDRVRALADELAAGRAGSPGLGVIAHRLRVAIGDRP